ncbi:MAG TPA: hypothetical protein VHL31_04025 [Geminicoccus sp.]|jgi:hypothetical protein|uniref:hypothetical protein n=1 Tax=Geminicoccus sp. TaxID=2024832 RepID=UPI002E319297|nr:hypothetical protein [Geminicoccus sp.]HEX2525458.1 hypothetical protein [Geminicoccus sp.]
MAAPRLCIGGATSMHGHALMAVAGLGACVRGNGEDRVGPSMFCIARSACLALFTLALLAATPILAAEEAAPPFDDRSGAFLDRSTSQLRLRPHTLVLMRPPVAANPKKSFKLFYAFNFANQPVGLDKCGLTRLPLLGPRSFFPDGKVLDRVDRTFADQQLPAIRKAFADAGSNPVVINIEGPWTIRRTDSSAVVAAKIDSHLDLAAYLRSRLGNKIRLGFYGEAPLKDYFSYQLDYFGNPFDPMYPEFVRAPGLADAVNRQVVRLAASADALFPPYYTVWYDDMGRTDAQRYQLTMQGWTTAAQESMKLALAWKKPVYPFIWMQYHNKINVPALANKFLAPGFFRYQLDTLRNLGADGVVIWGTLGPHGGREMFDRNADWWKDYLTFAKENGVDLAACPHLP